MTTHVFVVNENTFRYHLEYQFAGTGFSIDKAATYSERVGNPKFLDFNNNPTTALHSKTEDTLIGLMADGCRVRKGDLVLFYLEQIKDEYELKGGFYGVFQAVEDNVFIDYGENPTQSQLGMCLPFRLKIRPYKVFSKGVTEWEALDQISGCHKVIQSPWQMQWSLIYRKLKGKRGNTMITLYESEWLIDLIQRVNNGETLTILNNQHFTFQNYEIHTTSDIIGTYIGEQHNINLLPRLINKFENGKAFEPHLQCYITQNLGLNRNISLDTSIFSKNSSVEWIGNEVSCGVGMQRIDILASVKEDEITNVVYPIELKAVKSSSDNIRQLQRYIDWLEQYYLPNRRSIIQPVLICKKDKPLTKAIKETFTFFNSFNSTRGHRPLLYIEYQLDESQNNLIFERISY